MVSSYFQYALLITVLRFGYAKSRCCLAKKP